jgi:hypothetical protein
MRCASRGISRLCGRTSDAADFLQFRLQAELVERAQRQCREDRDALMQHPVGILERESDLGRGAARFRRIGNAPMRPHRLAGPHRTGFARGVVADREREIERRRPRPRKLAQDFERKAVVSWPRLCSRRTVSGWTSPFGWLPAL